MADPFAIMERKQAAEETKRKREEEAEKIERERTEKEQLRETYLNAIQFLSALAEREKEPASPAIS
jgi:hypothetical protein